MNELFFLHRIGCALLLSSCLLMTWVFVPSRHILSRTAISLRIKSPKSQIFFATYTLHTFHPNPPRATIPVLFQFVVNKPPKLFCPKIVKLTFFIKHFNFFVIDSNVDYYVVPVPDTLRWGNIFRIFHHDIVIPVNLRRRNGSDDGVFHNDSSSR